MIIPKMSKVLNTLEFVILSRLLCKMEVVSLFSGMRVNIGYFKHIQFQYHLQVVLTVQLR